MRSVLHDISNELHEYIKDTGFILVVLDSITLPVLTKKSKHKIKELKNIEEHIFHPGGNSHHYCSMMTNMPLSYATYPLSQTSDRTKNRLAVFAVKLRESFKAYLSDKDDWPTSYYSELLLDTLLEDLTPTEVKDLDVWYGRHEVQEKVYSVCYKITTDDKFLQNMMRSVDALPARTEANLESVNGRSTEFFKTSVLYARRKLIPRLSFQTSVIYRGTYGRKIPLSAMDDSCVILWWVKKCGGPFAIDVHSLMMIAIWCSPLLNALITSMLPLSTGQRYRFIRARDSSQNSGMTHKLWMFHVGCVTALPTSLLRSALCFCPTWMNGP